MAELRVEEWREAPPVPAGLGAFYATGYLAAARKAYGSALTGWVIGGGEPLAFFPLLRRGRRAVIPLLAQYWGLWPLWNDSPAPGRLESRWEQVVEAFTRWLAESGLVEASFVHPPRVDDVRPFLRGGWQVSPRYTYLVPPGDEAAWDSSTRRQAAKAAGLGLAVGATDDPRPLLELYRRMMRRQGFTPAPERLLLELAGQGKLLEARRTDGTLSAGLLWDRDTAAGYYVLAASDPATHGDGAPSALTAELLRRLAEERLPLDFVGANTPALCRFKRGFNGRPVLHFLTRLTPRPWSLLARRLGQVLRRG